MLPRCLILKDASNTNRTTRKASSAIDEEASFRPHASRDENNDGVAFKRLRLRKENVAHLDAEIYHPLTDCGSLPGSKLLIVFIDLPAVTVRMDLLLPSKTLESAAETKSAKRRSDSTASEQTIDSLPEPYIKEEPQSPPPFAAPSDSLITLQISAKTLSFVERRAIIAASASGTLSTTLVLAALMASNKRHLTFTSCITFAAWALSLSVGLHFSRLFS
ncbi:hypothetical protein HBI18_219680 [Parastagonospora nodorum]|nr:hypothetical protein HBI31_174090 [Parastagonospora nodorum]KAH5711446.1 hypothetical protein HBI18_219680 [Parastagonospora nodorum]